VHRRQRGRANRVPPRRGHQRNALAFHVGQRILSANAFAVYVLHPPVLVSVTLALRALQAGPLEKFTLLWAISAIVAFGIVAPAMRRVPGLSEILR